MRRKGLFRYDHRLKDNEEVKKLVSDTWREARNETVLNRISLVRRANSEWSRNQGVNSRLLIEKKRTE
uniref:Uncharacterized protein n=1 Tax=Brassica oleracea TaxID=3712 RepID=A0A3P6GV56_BRAOL|nr:unnamed protein product [Brassica oleracea]